MKPAQKWMIGLAFGLGLLSFAMRVSSPGWSTLILGPLVFVAILIHWALILFVAVRPYRKIVIALSITASVWLAIVVAFQVDFGDGGNPWFVFMSLAFDRLPETNLVPGWYPFQDPSPIVFDIAILASLIIPWVLIFILTPRKQLTK